MRSFFKDIQKKLSGGKGVIPSFMCAAVISGSGILSGFYPFGAAFVAAVPGAWLPAALIGAIFGQVFLTGEPLRYIATSVAAAGIRWAFSEMDHIRRKKLFASVNAMVSVGITSLIMFFSSGTLNADGIVKIATEAVCAAAGAYFISQSVRMLSSKPLFLTLDTGRMTSLIITAALFLLSLCRISVFGISVGNCAAVFLIALCGLCGGPAMGAIAGISAGIVSAMGTEELLPAAAAFALGGLMSGVFSGYGKTGVCTAFLLSCFIANSAFGDVSGLIPIMSEAVLGCAALVVLPDVVIKKIPAAGNEQIKSKKKKDISERRLITNRLAYAAETFLGISGAIKEVSDRLGESEEDACSAAAKKTKDDVCGVCGARARCGQLHESERDSAFETIAHQLGEGELTRENVPQYFDRHCICKDAIVKKTNSNYSDMQTKAIIRSRAEKVEENITEQFETMGEILMDINDELSNYGKEDRETAAAIRNELENNKITVEDIICRVNRNKRMSVEIKGFSSRHSRDGLSVRLRKALDAASDRAFETPILSVNEGSFYFRALEKAAFSVDFGAAQRTKGSGKYCGDSYDCYCDGRGHAVMLISDGMGTGGLAAVDGAMASAILTRMLRTGVGTECAMQAVNSALLAKSNDETLAALDLACFDLFSGNIEFLKAGAPATVVRHGDKTMRVEGSSLPVGIMKTLSLDKSGMRLNDGDIVVMASDGAAGELRRIEEIISEYCDEGAVDIAERIIQEIEKVSEDDDITVLVSKIRGNMRRPMAKSA